MSSSPATTTTTTTTIDADFTAAVTDAILSHAIRALGPYASIPGAAEVLVEILFLHVLVMDMQTEEDLVRVEAFARHVEVRMLEVAALMQERRQQRLVVIDLTNESESEDEDEDKEIEA